MAIVTFLVKIKNPSKIKHRQWVKDQEEYAKCLNWYVKRMLDGEKLSSKDVPFHMKDGTLFIRASIPGSVRYTVIAQEYPGAVITVNGEMHP